MTQDQRLPRTRSGVRGRLCPYCGEDHPDALTSNGMCYECSRVELGRSRIEAAHPWSREVSPVTVDMPANWHRKLDARRARRPDVLKHPGDDPLHNVAAVVATIAEGAAVLADHARRQAWPSWIAALAELFAIAGRAAADWLLVLAGRLSEQIGADWMEALDMAEWRLP